MTTTRRIPLQLTVALALAGAAHVANASRARAQDTVRLDHMIREDFFAGLRGDTAAFERAMRLLEDTLVANPRHAEALAWHGSGLLHEAARAFGSGQSRKGRQLWRRGMEEMDLAVTLEPENVSVLIPRAATLLAVSREVPSREEADRLLEQAVRDYEKVLALQRPYFGHLPLHARCELLTGLANGWHRLARADTARTYFERLTAECDGTGYAEEARAWLEGDTSPRGIETCRGCHVPR